MNDGFTLEIVMRLYAGQNISTTELKEVLRLAGVDAVIIDYIADIHTQKIEKKHYGGTIGKRGRQKMDAYFAVVDEMIKETKPIKLATAITRAAQTTGIPRSTLDRHLKDPVRKVPKK